VFSAHEALTALRNAAAKDMSAATDLWPFLTVAVAIVRGDATYDRVAFVTAAAPHIAPAELAIAGCVDRLESLLVSTFYSDEWLSACERRSQLEALRTFWPQALEQMGLLFFDCEGVDDLLRRKGDHEGGLRPEQIPPGTPTSHWWWWYPASPPA
jgi:hypothetical protein